MASPDRDLFSTRQGRARDLSHPDFADLVWSTIKALRASGYFDEALKPRMEDYGFTEMPPRITESDFLYAVKTGDVYRSLMDDKPDPLSRAPASWHETPDVLWDTVEFMYADVVSKDVGSNDWGQRRYEREAGQAEFRTRLNEALAVHVPAMELSGGGRVVERAPDELRPLLDEPVDLGVPSPLRDPLEGAIQQYRRRGATIQEKKAALALLASVLEPLRKDLDETILRDDTQALFHIANGFNIRHNKRDQKRGYDSDVWLDWMFYVYLATARAIIKTLDRQELADRVLGEQIDAQGGLPL